MKISFDWLKQLVPIDLDAEPVAMKLTGCGLEVEAIEDYEEVKGSLEGLVIGEVLTCRQHPNADKLKVTTVDVGGKVLPIVCGAPNVAPGQKVVVAPEGATLYPAGGEPFTIKKTKIRGEISEGMICAEDEIGMGKKHEGIMVLDTGSANGSPVNEHFKIFKDKVFEIGLTPNRGDAASHLGVARDIRALTGSALTLPSVDAFHVDNHDLPVEVRIENPEACPRYSGIAISRVTIMESPDWLKNRLRAIGLTPINNVVDITNFVMHELGQPLHAFDYDKIAGKKVIVKTLPDQTPFRTLDGLERKMRSGDLMICDEREGMCIAGVFGGFHSGITLNTKNIFLESACFNPAYVRKTALVHDLKTDASFRFERGTDPEITVYALKRAALLLKELAGGIISSELIDQYPRKISPARVEVKYKNLFRLIGQEIPLEQVREIISRLEIMIGQEDPSGITVEVPAYRVDVTREADVVEEILRIYGYDHIPLSKTLKADYLAEFPEKDLVRIHEKIAQMLSSRGFNEILTNSLTSPNLQSGISGIEAAENVEILNKLSDDLGVMRQSLLMTGLQVVAYNLSHKQKNLKLFEMGKTYHKKNSRFIEKNELVLFWTGDTEEENWARKPKAVGFHDIFGVAGDLMLKFNIRDFEIDFPEDGIFNEGLSIGVNGKIVSRLGSLTKELTRRLEVQQEIYFMKTDLDLFLDIINTNITFREVPKYPEVRRDLSLVIDQAISFREILKIVNQVERRLIRNVNVFDHYEGENIGKGKKAYALSFILQDPEKTLTDNVIDHTMNRLMDSFEKGLGAIIRK